jgi:hypothetical protein
MVRPSARDEFASLQLRRRESHPTYGFTEKFSGLQARGHNLTNVGKHPIPFRGSGRSLSWVSGGDVAKSYLVDCCWLGVREEKLAGAAFGTREAATDRGRKQPEPSFWARTSLPPMRPSSLLVKAWRRTRGALASWRSSRLKDARSPRFSSEGSFSSGGNTSRPKLRQETVWPSSRSREEK